jgi:uncharacterized protein with PhoU and TrkA domain
MVRDYARDLSATLSSTAVMSQSITQAHSNSAQDIAALVTNNIALNSHFINVRSMEYQLWLFLTQFI